MSIERIAFVEGQEVQKGQLLFVIDQRPYRAALASAQAQLERARAAAGLAQTQDQRARQLVAENAVSREEADTRAATLAQATAQVRAAEAELATARLQLDFTEVRADKGLRELTIEIGGKALNVAVADGLGNARVILDNLRSGEKQYHMVEIMACPGGCIGGGGQPYPTGGRHVLDPAVSDP